MLDQVLAESRVSLNGSRIRVPVGVEGVPRADVSAGQGERPEQYQSTTRALLAAKIFTPAPTPQRTLRDKREGRGDPSPNWESH